MSAKLKFSAVLIIFLIIIPVSIQSQSNPIRVACIGNSITEGIMMSSAAFDSYPADMQRYLGSGYDVRNFGKSGRTLLKKGDFPYWNEQVFTDAIAFDPNIVLISLGTNDSKPYNWVYKAEFLQDYYAMIDTFKKGASSPEIYVCYPLPAFSSAYDINGTVISDEIIPMIAQIVDSVDFGLIDFYTPFLDKSDLIPDGIHPMVEGTDIMARIILETVFNKAIVMQQENNVALNKKVYRGSEQLPQLVDNDAATGADFNSSSESVFINFGGNINIDMFQMKFNVSPPNFSFTVSTSTDSLNWNTIVDTALTDNENISNFSAKFNPVDANFLRFAIKGGSIAVDTGVVINELKVLETRAVHAPVLSWYYSSTSSTAIRGKLTIKKTLNKGEILKIYKQADEISPFTLYLNYRTTEPAVISTSIKFGVLNRYYTVAYYDGIEITSDTLTIISPASTGFEDNSEGSVPTSPTLFQNYPNPFNPETVIEFSIAESNNVTIEIFDISGSRIRTICNQMFSSGSYRLLWDGKNENSNLAVSGVYYYQLKVANKPVGTKKMVLLRSMKNLSCRV